MSELQKKFKLTHELRIVVASLLSLVVILLWAKYFGPKPPTNLPQANRPVQTAPATPGSSTPSSTLPSAKTTPGSKAPGTSISGVVQAATPPKADTEERTLVVENDLYHVEFSNRGAVVKSWQLKHYTDDWKPPRILDLVHPEAAQQTGGWPFAVALNDQEQESAANSALYRISTPASTLQAPADVEFSWSDGHLEVTKRLHFDHTYVVRVETSVKVNGAPVPSGTSWLGGFGDQTVSNPAPIDTVSIFYSENGKLTNIPAKKLEGPEKWPRGVWQGGKDWDGIEDRYFTAAFLPLVGAPPGSLEVRYWKDFRTVQVEGKDTQEPVPQIQTATSAQPLSLRVYVGPKDYDELKKMNPPLHSLVNFGWLEFIADPLFHGLKWLHKYIPNWGWDIVVLTLIINMLLFPLRISSYRTTLKMQRVAPEIKQIQEKYKKYSMRDPRKAEMNKEVMAVYSREKINPVGGCFQMFLQMPIWFGLNTVLRYAIEMRHASWFGWIRDLSAKDPYYILPITMGLSMYLVSKMTPMTTTDPQQQMMMKIMPVTMAGLFMISPISSGLAVYILTSSLVGIVQQWWLNRTHPLPAAAPSQARGKNGKNKKK
ncbi:MAG: Membrane protein insertase YidC [Candidatus Acidoferrum typicum]|nr:Membrane protein insertase YidC [Candidatus Acidoferrum typicum]